MTNNQSLQNLKMRYFQTDQYVIETSDVKNSKTDSERLYGLGKNIINEKQPKGSSQEHLINLGATTAPDSPNEGDLWNDSQVKILFFYSNSMAQSISSVIFTNNGPYQVIASTADPIDIIDSGYLTIPANFLAIGKTIRITVQTVFTNTDPLSVAQINASIDGWSLNTNYYSSGGSQSGFAVYNGTITTQTIGSSGIINLYEEYGDFKNASSYSLNTTVDNKLRLQVLFSMVGAGEFLDIFNLIIEVLN